ncbi:cytochrome P450 [Russula earlei]|uniref:Cytochrome P450 n=1 Tax=Russula earlei TaxID=71964 RepID=A0ACC0U1T8_9AGAM|nr:cytochrome P450 [Russula earlei]
MAIASHRTYIKAKIESHRQHIRSMSDSSVLLRLFIVPVVRSLFVVVLALSGTLATYVLSVLVMHRIAAYRSPLRDLPGPENAHWFKGNFVDVPEPDSGHLQEEWVQKYGHVLKFHYALAAPTLLTVDPVAVSYVLQNTDTFQKTDFLRFHLGALAGNGLALVEGTQHKKQRRVMNPAFGLAQVRRFTSLFLEKSLQLREIWGNLLSGSTRKDGKVGLDALMWLNKATLDIVGLAGFNYSFDSLHSPDEEQSDLYWAVRAILEPTRDFSFILQLFFPFFRFIPTHRSRTLNRALKEIRRVGSQLIQEKKTAVLAENDANGSSAVGKQDVQGHDLLSLLIKSNIAVDKPESMRMSDTEIVSQIPTFLLAGHETTSVAIAWTLFALGLHPAVQAKLRAELRTCPTDFPSMDQLNALPYLESVVREALRLYPPVFSTSRVAMCDAAIPLQKPFTDKHGNLQSTIRVSKGDWVNIPICLLNRSTAIWGDDANEFRPERWEYVPEMANGLPSVYGHLVTFIAGAHACIGFRFSVMQIKTLIFTLVRAFEFEMARPAEDIIRSTDVVSRPVIVSNPAAGPQLPMLIRLANLD